MIPVLEESDGGVININLLPRWKTGSKSFDWSESQDLLEHKGLASK